MIKENRLMENFRYEKKFLVPELDFYEIEFLVKQNPKVFSETFYERRINNIYFDSFSLGNYYDNLAGTSKRLKIRIRWYGKIFGIIKNPVLELKIKEGEVGRKISFKLNKFILDRNFSLRFLQKEIFEKSNLPNWLVEKLRLSRPILLNSYKRKYFISADKKYRITLDKNLIFFKINNQNNNFVERILDKNINILELKHSGDNDNLVSDITQHFPFRLSASSKYVYGVDLLELW